MYNVRLKFQQVFIVFGVIACFLIVFAGEFFDALIAVPFGNGPEMTLVAFDAAQYFHTQISRGIFIIADTGVYN